MAHDLLISTRLSHTGRDVLDCNWNEPGPSKTRAESRMGWQFKSNVRELFESIFDRIAVQAFPPLYASKSYQKDPSRQNAPQLESLHSISVRCKTLKELSVHWHQFKMTYQQCVQLNEVRILGFDDRLRVEYCATRSESYRIPTIQ